MDSINDFLPVFELEGATYRFRRLGVRDVSALMRIVSTLTTEGWQHLQIRLGFLRELSTLDQANTEALMGMMMIAFGVPEVEEELYKFMARILYKCDAEGNKTGDVTVEDFTNPDIFPAFTVALSVLQLLHHPDLEMLKQAVELGVKLPFFQAAVTDAGKEAAEELKAPSAE